MLCLIKLNIAFFLERNKIMARKPKTTKAEAPTEVTEAPAGDTTVNLSVADLAAAVQIIDFAAARGAFTGENISKVGQVRDRLAEVVTALTPAEEAAGEAPAEAN